jgi:hypothetical protein
MDFNGKNPYLGRLKLWQALQIAKPSIPNMHIAKCLNRPKKNPAPFPNKNG